MREIYPEKRDIVNPEFRDIVHAKEETEMTNVIELLEAVKTAKGIETKYALAKELNIPTQRISDYYNGKTFPDNDACLEIAKALGRNLEEIITLVQIDAAKDDKRREKWQSYYKSIGGYAASILVGFIFVVSLIVTPTPAEATPIQVFNLETICIMLSVLSVVMQKNTVSIVMRTLSTLIPRFGFSG